MSGRDVSDVNPDAVIILNLVLFNRGLGIHGHQDSHIFVLFNFVMRNDRDAAENHDAVVVFGDLVVLDPGLARFDDENTLAATALDLVIHNKGIHTLINFLLNFS